MRKFLALLVVGSVSLVGCSQLNDKMREEQFLTQVRPYFSYETRTINDETLLEVGYVVCEAVDEDPELALLAMAGSTLTSEQAVQLLFGALENLCPDVADKHR